MAAYCRAHDLSSSSLGYWKKRLRKREAAAALEATSAASVSLPIARVRRRAIRPDIASAPAPNSSLRVIVGSVAVEVPPRFDPGALSRLLDVLATRGAA